MQLNRRQFLTACGSFLTGLGVLNTLLPLLEQQGAAQAQSSPKKLALLVGINQYQNRAKFPELKGCVTDVELMRNLLIHRFGFNPQDIHVLTNEAATRRAIELAFQTHLIDQAKSSDVVVFHFSGFGQYLLPQSNEESSSSPPMTQYGLLPHDAVWAADQNSTPKPSINAILQETLYLFIQSLKTDRVVTLLDTGFHYPGVSNLDHSRIRSLPAGLLEHVNPAEVQIQDELLASSKIKRSKITEQRLNTPPRGLVVTAAYLQQFGIEADWQDFSAGALTYSLAQQVWHTAPNSSFAAQVSRSAEFLAQEFSLTQQPELVGQKKSTLTRDVLGLPASLSGDGVILDIDGKGKTGQVWLGGMVPTLLKTDKTRSILSVLSNQPGSPPETLVKLTARKGLWGNAQVLGADSIAVGDPVKERFRQISKNQPLRLALSTKLEKVEKIDATSVFGSNGSEIKVVANDQSADIVLSKLERVIKVDPEQTDANSAEPPSTQTFYCLSSLAGDVLPGTINDRPEAVKNKYEAFKSSFDVLRWHQCLEQLINSNNSDLSASAALERKSESGPKNILLAKSTTAAAKGLNTVPADSTLGQILTVSPDSKFQLTLTNSSAETIYLYIFGFDAQPNAIVIYQSIMLADDSTDRRTFQPFKIEPSSDLVLPSESEEFGVYGPSGLGSLYLLLTRSPLPQTAKAIDLATNTANKGSQAKQVKVSDPVRLRKAVLSDLEDISQSQVDARIETLLDDKHWTLSLNAWAMMRFVYQIL